MISRLFIVTACAVLFAASCNGKQIDCSLVDCLPLECPTGQVPQPLQSGQCCSTTCIKLDCSAVSCLAVEECNGEIVTPPGQCCPTCQPRQDCSSVLCALPLCQNGEVLETPPGECCPVCTRPDCAAVLCLAAEECNGKLFTLPGECCPRCQPDCTTVNCARPPCKEGGVIETPPGQCCPVCTGPNCAAVLCLALIEEDCEEGETLVTPPGECCAKCQPELKLDCSTVLCAKRICFEGQTSQVPEGQCCPVCVDDNDNECPIQGQVYSNCASPCPATCDSDPNQFCITLCVQGCTCPPGQVIDAANNRCVEPNNCPPKKSCNLACPPGHRCTVDKFTNEKFCSPDCELDNGGCPAGQTCSLETVLCVQAPCLPGSAVSCSCPPDCSREYCSENPNGICSNPGPREIPGCTGSCQLAYCSACIFGVESPAVPSNTQKCKECPDYSTPNVCYWRWSRCVGRRLQKANKGMESSSSSDAVFCLSPTCPFIG